MLWSTMLLMTSCSVDETYSCDPTVDDWIKANYAQLQDITRVEFLNLPNGDIQRATFRAVSQQKRIELWLLKIDELLELPWTTAEKEHIDLLKDLIKTNSDWFQDRSSLHSNEIQFIEDELVLTMYAWADYARMEFVWADQTLYALVGTLDSVNSLESLQKEIGKTRSNITIAPGDEPIVYNDDCDCNLTYTFCKTGVTTCQENNCGPDPDFGCGWLWAFECNGKCKPI